ncbi:hypothetical protein PABG_11979 [Paracoccidioides brasiliensis Pb03]|nr:hypothetical protein PABG_11979 [Paracoccidioides brasiliensis Pb03]
MPEQSERRVVVNPSDRSTRKVPRHDRPVEQKKTLNSNLMGFFAEDVWEMQSFSPKRLTGEPGQTIK